MKQAIGFLIIITAVCTYLYSLKSEFNWDLVTGTVGKFRIILGIIYLLFGHIYGAVIGVLVGFWLIFKN